MYRERFVDASAWRIPVAAPIRTVDRMIEVRNVSKRYGDRLAVDDLTFDVQPGRITGFLGPNGAGKSTTMRIILGLDSPTSGTATIAGMSYRELSAPLRRVGSLLDANARHPGRTARQHLVGLARSNRLPSERVDDVLALAGLTDVADRRAGGYSLGMGQRLGIAAALLGEPHVLILDEPVNGLDTDGIRWIRDLLKRLAREGRTVLLSSHLMSEMELTADHLVVIGRGRLIADTTMTDFIERNSKPVTIVRTPQPDALRTVLDQLGAGIELDPTGAWRISGPDAATIGDVARHHDIGLHELTPRYSSLEDIYTHLTHDSVDFHAAPGAEVAV